MASDHLRLGFLLQFKYLNRTTPDSFILYCYYCSLVPKFCPTLPHHGLAHQALLSMGFPRQAYWSGLPFPSPGGLPNPGIEPGLLLGRLFTTEPSWVLLLQKKKKLPAPRLHPILVWRPENPRSSHRWKQWPQIISDWGSSYSSSILIGLHLTLLFYIVTIVL